MIEVLFDNRQDFMEIKEENMKAVEKAINATIEFEQAEGNFEVSVSFVTNEEIKELNRIYRNVDSDTDVLSFPMDDEEDQEGVIMLGDVILSTQKIIEQAKNFGHSLEREMIYLTVHSMLHLLGYDHMMEDEKEEMRDREKEVMKSLQLFK
ncbi:putative rRNA maturation factor [Sedimentibacter acidaminivorans]|uniref:Endoribonuclease YbeY n=1 Tax=Sedimentibacter acidaminivorans TaxID=913099 RepID=A0ABS4GCM9_9FIRM|nr:rRNA maturation RNase YbeY [Sedimentibacter acidaminivorans]MBP1925450.1 putative rRNA maturation factor [Sedimentibacter acidaminivorans]